MVDNGGIAIPRQSGPSRFNEGRIVGATMVEEGCDDLFNDDAQAHIIVVVNTIFQYAISIFCWC